MPITTDIVGQQTRVIEHDVDARWLMAYAAGLEDCNSLYLDTSKGTVIGHPVFPVCLEWPAILAARELKGSESVTPEESARGVHADHDLHIYKPIEAGETYSTRATVTSLKAIKPGAAQMTRLDTIDSKGEMVARTWQLGISRGVPISGADTVSEEAPALPDLASAASTSQQFQIPVREGAANIYTECAHIWNPIHSDKAFALAAGLPDIILHGTATLALGITCLVDEFLEGDSRRVRRLGGRFVGMVFMPTTLIVEVNRLSDDLIGFTINDSNGQVVFNQGFLVIGDR
jgi:acyl dehydratase